MFFMHYNKRVVLVGCMCIEQCECDPWWVKCIESNGPIESPCATPSVPYIFHCAATHATFMTPILASASLQTNTSHNHRILSLLSFKYGNPIILAAVKIFWEPTMVMVCKEYLMSACCVSNALSSSTHMYRMHWHKSEVMKYLLPCRTHDLIWMRRENWNKNTNQGV